MKKIEILSFRSIKCRFTALGILLGLLLSLAAIIPITVIWQTSKSGRLKFDHEFNITVLYFHFSESQLISKNIRNISKFNRSILSSILG